METTYHQPLRVSSLPRFLACPSSDAHCPYPYNPPSDAADVGTAVHECCAAMVTGHEYDPATVARKYGVDAEEASILCACAEQAWRELKPHFPEPDVEVVLESVSDGLRGHADVVSADGSTLAVLDWKSGRVRHDYSAQLQGYALCAERAHGMPKSGVVTVATVWLRMGEIDVRNYSAKDLDGFTERLAEARGAVGKRYAPGDACTFCPRKHSCDALVEYVRSVLRCLEREPTPVDDIDPERLASIWQRSRLLKRSIDAYERAMKALLVDGPVDAPGGHTLELKTDLIEKLESERAWPILVEEGLSNEALARCVRLSKTAVTREVSARTAKGYKGKAIDALLNRLREAGAIKTEGRQTICKRKAKR